MSARGRASAVAVAATAVALAGCLENRAPGNDREAALDRPRPGAEVVAAAEALANVDPGLLQPQIMSDADAGNLPTGTGSCRFRMTRVGFPVLAYGGGGSAVLKLNGKLVPLSGAGGGRFTAEGVEATVRPLEGEGGEPTELAAAELVLRFEGAPNELGFHGYAGC